MAELLALQLSGSEDLRDLLFEHGVEFPCGGGSLCAGCRVRVIEGYVPITPGMRDVLDSSELADGWRLGCEARANGTVLLEIEQWSTRILTDETALPSDAVEGYGIAIDLGTTTVVAQLIHLASGDVTALETALNPQCRYGSDIMSRVQFELQQPGVLRRLIRELLGDMVVKLCGRRRLREVLIAGNTVMRHLFCGEDVEPLSHVPFRSPATAGLTFTPADLGWPVDVECGIRFLPCIGGFVGSDLLAGLAATGMADSEMPVALLDLGTNGEAAVGSRHGIVCASTAAGPAFEGGRIRKGMRAGTGAIDKVVGGKAGLSCHVIGGGTARGICGSGLVDAVASARELGWIEERGRFASGRTDLVLQGRIGIVQADIRELQLAKAAICAALEILLQYSGIDPPCPRLLLAGAFGNYIRVESARRIGLIPAGAGEVCPAGNTALRGVRMLLLRPHRREETLDRLLKMTRHLELGARPDFQNVFVERMIFPTI